jgi:predicted nucleic acid-binding protein
MAAHQQRLSHGWKPVLTDPDDEPLVQLAVEGGAGAIVTYNVRHLQPAAQFGMLVLTPKEFLIELRKNK